MSNYFSTNPAELRKPFQDEIPQICSVTPRLKGRHLGFTCPRGRGYFASRLSHTSKSISSFQLKRLILSGDVCPNPGPAKCPVCIKTVARNHRALNCNLCQQWIHIKCGDVKPKDFKQIQSTRSNWSCSVCLFLELPLSDCYISNDIMSNANLVPTDAEMFLSFTQDLYPSLRTDLRHFPGFKVAHLNVNGLLSKILDIRALLSSIKFDILAITESHLNDNISNNVINIAGYKIARNDRKDGRKGGGSVIYFADHLDAYERYDINSHISLEATWIDITIKSQLCKHFSARLKKLKHLKGLNENILETIYFKGILPSITYSISVWGSSNSFQTLEDIHIRAARFIHNIKDSIAKVDVLDKAKWQPISYMYKKRMACIAYQAYYNQAPDSINNLFIKHHPQRALRDNLKFQIQRPNSNFRRDSFSHRACNLWNNLPVTIKNKPSLSLF